MFFEGGILKLMYDLLEFNSKKVASTYGKSILVVFLKTEVGAVFNIYSPNKV